MKKLLLLAFLAISAPAWAALSSNKIVTPQTPKLAIGQITNGNGTTAQTFYAAGSNGSKVLNPVCTSTDTSNRDVVLTVLRSATAYQLGYTQITAASGNGETVSTINLFTGPPSAAGTTTPAVNNPAVPLPVDSDGNSYLLLSSGDTLQIGAGATITSGKFITCFANIADF